MPTVNRQVEVGQPPVWSEVQNEAVCNVEAEQRDERGHSSCQCSNYDPSTSSDGTTYETDQQPWRCDIADRVANTGVVALDYGDGNSEGEGADADEEFCSSLAAPLHWQMIGERNSAPGFDCESPDISELKLEYVKKVLLKLSNQRCGSRTVQ